MAGELNFFGCRTCHGISQRSSSSKTPSGAAAFVVGSWWAIHHLLQRLLGLRGGSRWSPSSFTDTRNLGISLRTDSIEHLLLCPMNLKKKGKEPPTPSPLSRGVRSSRDPSFFFVFKGTPSAPSQFEWRGCSLREIGKNT